MIVLNGKRMGLFMMTIRLPFSLSTWQRYELTRQRDVQARPESDEGDRGLPPIVDMLF